MIVRFSLSPNISQWIVRINQEKHSPGVTPHVRASRRTPDQKPLSQASGLLTGYVRRMGPNWPIRSFLAIVRLNGFRLSRFATKHQSISLSIPASTECTSSWFFWLQYNNIVKLYVLVRKLRLHVHLSYSLVKKMNHFSDGAPEPILVTQTK